MHTETAFLKRGALRQVGASDAVLEWHGAERLDAMERSALMEQYRVRVAEAKARYLRAVAHAESVGFEFYAGDIPNPDGSLAFREALTAESAALQAYMDARRALTTLTLQGTGESGDT